MATKKKSATTPSKTSRKKTTTKKAVKETYIALVVDRSGSMRSVQTEALTGINEQIETIKKNAKKGGKTFVTCVQFNDSVDVLFDKKPSKELKKLTENDYIPGGLTAMYDGVHKAITSLKEVTSSSDDIGYLVVVISDGMENASREVTAPMLAKEIKELEATGKWTFTYMLSNQDLKVVTDKLGVSAGNIAAYSSTNIGTKDAFANIVKSTSSYFTRRVVGDTSTKDFYNTTTPEDEMTKKNDK